MAARSVPLEERVAEVVIAGRPSPESPEPAVPWEGGGAPLSVDGECGEPSGLPDPGLLELFPRRSPPWGIVLTAAAVTGLLLAGYRGLGASRPLWVSRPISAFGLEGPGNLASCVSTLVLTSAAVAGLLVWWLLHSTGCRRRQIWLVAAGWWFFMGLDESSGLHAVIGPLLHEMFGARDPASPWWWAVPYVVIFCAILSRLIFDLRYSGWSTFWMSLAVGMYGLSGLIQTGLISTGLFGGEPVLWEELGELVGHWCVLLGMMSFGQFVLRSFRGELAAEVVQEAPPDPHQADGPPGVEPSRAAYIPPAEDDARYSGDYVIIHPPHGQGPPVAVPRAVRRVVRRTTAGKTTAGTSRRRSDLDLPAGYRANLRNPTAGVGPTPAAGNAPNSSSPVSRGEPSAAAALRTDQAPQAATNAFLAGMAYAEARQTESARQTAVPPTFSAQATLPTAASVLRPMQPGAGGPTQPPAGPTSPTGGAPAAGQVTGAGANLPQLPSRRLTKEEKKRLKQLYKQRMAELEAQN